MSTKPTETYKYPYIESKSLYFRLLAIDKLLDCQISVREHHQGLVIDEELIIAKNKPLFRPLGIIDWAHFTPKGLAKAINSGSASKYYKKMLKDPLSPQNKWCDKKLEREMKSFYLKRAKELRHD